LTSIKHSEKELEKANTIPPPPVFFSPSTSASNKNYLFGEIEVDCIISDMFYVWSVDVADKLGIPRIVFFSFW